jgi:mannan endo-1,4-beta-mannosidase
MGWKRAAVWCSVGTAAVVVPSVVALTGGVSSAKEPTSYRVEGNSLFDPCGQRIVVRGIEQYFANPTIFPDGKVITEAAKTGANTFRVVPFLGYPAEGGPADWSAIQPGEVEHLIRTTLDDHMLADVALAGGKVDDAYLDPAYKAVLMKYQDRIVIHARGEGYEDTGQEWEDNAKATIAKLRGAGYTAPLYILANNGGRNLKTILDHAQAVLAADPLHQVVFGWQAYWSGDLDNTTDFYQRLTGMSLRQAFQAVHDAPFMIQVGLSGDQFDLLPARVDWQAELEEVQRLGLNWLWWDWGLSNGQLTTNGNDYGSWDTSQFDALAVVEQLAATSERTSFQRNGTCAR